MSTAVAPAPSNGTAVAQKQDNSIRGWLKSASMKEQFAQALPKHLSADRFIRVALTALTRTPKLAECDQASFFKCLLDLSSLGLEPDGRRAHLIPFNNTSRNCVECQLIVDYKGIAELVMRSGLVSNLHADVVCENDDFEYDKGFITVHKIDFKKERGKPYAVYCVCRFRDGTEKCDVMTLHEVEAIRKRSRAGRNGPWVTDFNEMAKKTVFRRLSKWLPWSSEIRNALETDDDQYDDAPPAVAGPANGVLLTTAETRSEQLAAMLGSSPAESGEESQVTDQNAGEESQESQETQTTQETTTREPGDDPVEEKHESVRLSDLALAIEAELHEPGITAAQNTAKKQQVIEALSEKALTLPEATHLQRIVSENAERLAAKKK